MLEVSGDLDAAMQAAVEATVAPGSAAQGAVTNLLKPIDNLSSAVRDQLARDQGLRSVGIRVPARLVRARWLRERFPAEKP